MGRADDRRKEGVFLGFGAVPATSLHKLQGGQEICGGKDAILPDLVKSVFSFPVKCIKYNAIISVRISRRKYGDHRKPSGSFDFSLSSINVSPYIVKTGKAFL
ncbi:hypothetical protein Naga_100555g3 [Nannochloropsis gaditana]|uniref:Uncharacterized protein n=1 Tax=Nannochloropsis gaditana TaxID=72520 RepID=W7TNC8_9STRA|nr:hypothetical protein Naga_100555g3 [Nannochloropsis gaditana]